MRIAPPTPRGEARPGEGDRHGEAHDADCVRIVQDRDRFFADRAEESRRHFDQPIRANKGMCRSDEFGCQHMIAEMERARDEELARLEKLREATLASP